MDAVSTAHGRADESQSKGQEVMAPYVGTHMTHKRNLGAIKRWGLIPRKPTEYNYQDAEWLRGQPTGVYVKHDGPPWREWGVFAGRYRTLDVAYVGPMMNDPIVEGAMVLLDRVPPEHITVRPKA